MSVSSHIDEPFQNRSSFAMCISDMIFLNMKKLHLHRSMGSRRRAASSAADPNGAPAVFTEAVTGALASAFRAASGAAIMAAMSAATLPGCSMEDIPAGPDAAQEICGIHIDFRCGEAYETRAAAPDEEKISDLNIFLFDSDGCLVSRAFLRGLDKTGCPDGWDTEWLLGTECRIFACANFGFEMKGISTAEDIRQFRYHMAYPDEYSRGIPMSGEAAVTVSRDMRTVSVQMTRLMSRITLAIDRSSLDANVKFHVRSARICGSPRSVNAFADSRATGRTDTFSQGFIHSLSEADALNIDADAGVSRTVSLYMLENLQGDLLPDISGEEENVLDGKPDAVSEVCSYIELKIEYISEALHTGAENYLIYRFYLGEGPGNFDVRRNCCYRITVKPTGTGLAGVGWRVDKSALTGLS